MNIYKISQDINNEYDTYDSAIVIANDEEEASRMSPAEYNDKLYFDFENSIWSNWAYKIEDVKVELIGVADKKFKEPCLILSSYNAG